MNRRKTILASTLALVILLGTAFLLVDKDCLSRQSDEGLLSIAEVEQQYLQSIETGTLEEQLHAVNRYIEEARRQGQKTAEVEALAQRAVLYYNNDMNDSVLTVVRSDMEIVKAAGEWNFYYEMWSRIANTYLFMNQNRLALRETEAMYAFARSHKSDFGMGLAYCIMGTAYANMRNFDQSIDAYQKSIAMLSAITPTPAMLPDAYAYYGNALNDMKDYQRLEALTHQWHTFLMSYFKERHIENTPIADVNLAYYYMACVQAALGLKKLSEAEQFLEQSKTHFNGEDAEWLYYMGQLRLLQGRYDEALNYNNRRMKLLEEGSDKTDRVMVTQQRAEIMEQQKHYDNAANLYRQIYQISDSANAVDTKSQLVELNTIFQVSDLEMQNERNRFRFIIIVATVIMLSLAIFLFFRIRSARRLKQAHGKLQVAYEDLQAANRVIEETTAAKERIESELRIARDIQMGMVPSVFPVRNDLDLYASMTPAKEVGGDLYDYQIIDDRQLYFCVGDVSGKGVPASLFMAQATRLFRTLAKQRMMPAEIATRLNAELGEDNEQGMFVTMFIGLADLETGHLDFCNAGHNPPVLANHFIEMIPNAPIGLWPELEYEGEQIEQIIGQPLFIYTDGLNEAENSAQEQFGDDHLLEVFCAMNYENARQTVEYMVAEVASHVAGAEPSDDLTMMCLMIKGS